MTEGQKKFRDFILANVKNGMADQAEALLAESFRKQADGTFNADYISNIFMPRMMAMIREDRAEQVKQIMVNFRSKLS